MSRFNAFLCASNSSLTVMALALVSIGRPAMAQQATAASAAETGSATAVPEIVVTARKRSESLLQTPVAVSALDAQTIQTAGIARLEDVTNKVPNISLSSGSTDLGAGAAVIFIRGIGQTDFANSVDPGVGVYVDGVYLGRSIGANLDLPGIEQIEILRGPQGTLFGKNTMGGAINITTHRPGSENAGTLLLTAGERGRLNAEGTVDLAVTDSLGLSVAGAYRSRNGYVKHPRLPALGGEDVIVARGKLLFEHGGFSAQLSGDYTDLRGTTAKTFRSLDAGAVGDSLTQLWNFVPAAFLADLQDNGAIDGSRPPIPGLPTVPYSVLDGNGPVTANLNSGSLRAQSGNSSNRLTYKGGGTSLKLEQELGEATLRSITAYRKFSSYSSQDQDGLPQNLAFGVYEDHQNQFSQEFNIFGKAVNGSLDWLVGGYYFRESAKADQLIAVAYPFFAINNRFNTKVDSYAAFSEVTWRFADRWSLIGGLRYTHETKDFSTAQPCRPEMVLPICAGGFYVAPTQASASWDAFNPRVGIQYRPSNDWMIYAQYSTGFKSGGFNARPSTVAVAKTPYNPETLDAFEGGIKTRVLDGRASFRAAAFFYKYRDLQFTVSGVDSRNQTPLSVSGNLGNAEMLGLEAEATIRPTTQLTIDAAFGLLDAKYTSLDAALLAVVLSSGQGAVDLNSKLPKAPSFTVNLGVQYVIGIGSGSVTPRVDFAYVSKQYSEVQNFELTASPRHTNVNARLTYMPDSKRWSFSLYGRNLFNETYVVNGFWPSGGANARVFLTPNEPRELGATLGFNF